MGMGGLCLYLRNLGLRLRLRLNMHLLCSLRRQGSRLYSLLNRILIRIHGYIVTKRGHRLRILCWIVMLTVWLTIYARLEIAVRIVNWSADSACVI